MWEFFRARPKKRSVKLKRKSGVIFNNPSSVRRKVFAVGTTTFLVSLMYLIYLYQPIVMAFIKFKRAKPEEIKSTIEKLETRAETPKNNEFWIQIPKILAKADVKADVSPFNPEEYLTVLKEDVVAHSKTSGFPGQGKNVYLFAHSTEQGPNLARKNSVFYLLGELAYGDSVYLNYQGKIYTYVVNQKKIVKANEIEYLNYSEDGESLILQTCWPIGTDWQRLLVFARLKK